MLNLLNKEERNAIKKEYFLRLSSIVIIFLTLLLVIWGIALSVPYIQIYIEKGIIKEQVEKIQSSDLAAEKENIQLVSRELKKKLRYLELTKIDPSVVLTEVLSSQNDGISLSVINIQHVQNEESKNINIELRGIAKSRNDLVAFRDSISEKELFNKVDIPFSNFAQEADVPFTIGINSVDLNKYLENE